MVLQMASKPQIVCIILAKLQSTRFSKKTLSNLLDKPLMQWVWEAANNIKIFDDRET